MSLLLCLYVFFFASNWSRAKPGILHIIVIVVYHHSLEAVANYDLNFYVAEPSYIQRMIC